MLKCRHPVLHFSGYHCITVFKWITLNFPREDIVTKMCRNAIYFPESGDIPTHFAQTIACQGHLAPLPLNTAPVYWDFDRFISLLFMLIFHINIYILLDCMSVFCLFVSNKPQNGWTDLANQFSGTSRDPREGLYMIEFLKICLQQNSIFENL